MITQTVDYRGFYIIIFLLSVSLQVYSCNTDCDTVKEEVYVENAKIIDRPLYDFLKSNIVPAAKDNMYNPRRDYYVINCYPKEKGDTIFFVTYEIVNVPFTVHELSSKTRLVVTNIDGINFYIPLDPEDCRWVESLTTKTYIGSYEYRKGDSLSFVWDMKDEGASWLLKSSKGSIELLSFRRFNSPPANTDWQQQNVKNDFRLLLPNQL